MHTMQIIATLATLIKTVLQVTIPPRTIVIVSTTFNGIPEPDCHYSFMEPSVTYMSQPNIFVVSELQILGRKLPVFLLCTIINTSSDDIILPKNQHLGEMKPLSSPGDPLKPSVVNKSHMKLTLTILTHNGCNLTALHTINVKPTVPYDLYQKHQF